MAVVVVRTHGRDPRLHLVRRRGEVRRSDPTLDDAVVTTVEDDHLGDLVAVAVDPQSVPAALVLALVSVQGQITDAEQGDARLRSGAGEPGEVRRLEDRRVRSRAQPQDRRVTARAAEVHPGVQGEPARHVHAGWEEDDPTVGAHIIDSGLEGVSVVRRAVTPGPVVADVCHRAARGEAARSGGTAQCCGAQPGGDRATSEQGGASRDSRSEQSCGDALVGHGFPLRRTRWTMIPRQVGGRTGSVGTWSGTTVPRGKRVFGPPRWTPGRR